MSLLKALTGWGATPPSYTPDPFPLDVTSQIIFDGSSIMANHGNVAPIATLFAERIGNTGAVISNSATNGETWAKMTEGGLIPVESVRDDQRPNLAIIACETGNSVKEATAEQVIEDAKAYFAKMRSLWPYAILGALPATPRGHGDWTAYPIDKERNEKVIAVNQWMAANPDELGIDVWIDVRTPTPMFNHDGSDVAKFEAYAEFWQESPGSVFWPEFGYLHPTLGTWPESGEATGKRAIAAIIADAFLDGKIRASA